MPSLEPFIPKIGFMRVNHSTAINLDEIRTSAAAAARH